MSEGTLRRAVAQITDWNPSHLGVASQMAPHVARSSLWAVVEAQRCEVPLWRAKPRSAQGPVAAATRHGPAAHLCRQLAGVEVSK